MSPYMIVSHKCAIDPHLIWEVIARFEKKMRNSFFYKLNNKYNQLKSGEMPSLTWYVVSHKCAIYPHLIWEVIDGFEKKIATHSYTNSTTSIVRSKVGNAISYMIVSQKCTIYSNLIWEEIARIEKKYATHSFTNSTTSIVRSKVGKCHLLHDSESQMRNRSPLNVKSFFGMIIINPWGGSWELSTLNSVFAAECMLDQSKRNCGVSGLNFVAY